MKRNGASMIERIRQRRALRHWSAYERLAARAPRATLKRLQTMSAALGQRLDNVRRITGERLADLDIPPPENLPPSTDWTQRPALWRKTVQPSGHAPAGTREVLAPGAVLYHDCRETAVIARQMAAAGPHPRALVLETFDFDGTFLSLVLEAAREAAEGLAKHHVLRLTMQIAAERDVSVTARLNLKHGPNTEQLDKPFDQEQGFVEFDLAYVPFREGRAEQVWFDLFLADPAFNRITIGDLFLSRHRRAQL